LGRGDCHPGKSGRAAKLKNEKSNSKTCVLRGSKWAAAVRVARSSFDALQVPLFQTNRDFSASNKFWEGCRRKSSISMDLKRFRASFSSP
jgi:hypothetical protein